MARTSWDRVPIDQQYKLISWAPSSDICIRGTQAGIVLIRGRHYLYWLPSPTQMHMRLIEKEGLSGQAQSGSETHDLLSPDGDPRAQSCSCRDWQCRRAREGKACKHLAAAWHLGLWDQTRQIKAPN